MRVNGLTEEAVFDTGANVSFASMSYAHRHKLRLLQDEVSFASGTSKSVPGQVGMADEVKVGKMTFQHVVFVVVRDEDLAFLSASSAINVIMGSPLIIALGHLRVAADGNSMEVGLPSDTISTSPPERNLVFDRLNPLVQLHYRGNSLSFALDTGSDRTSLFVRFGQRFPEVLSNTVPSTQWRNGISNLAAFSVRTLSQLELNAGKVSVLLHGVTVFTEDRSAFSPVFGVVGENFLSSGFELDFSRMEFSLAGNGTGVNS